MKFTVLSKKLFPLSVLAVMPIIPDLMRETFVHPSIQADFSLFNNTVTMQPGGVAVAMEPEETMEPAISPTVNKTPVIMIDSPTQPFTYLVNDTIFPQPTVAVNETVETMAPAISPSFSPVLVVSTEEFEDVEFDSIRKTLGDQWEAVVELTVDIFDSISETLKLFREKFLAFLADLYGLFDTVKIKFGNIREKYQIQDLIDTVFDDEITIHHVSSAPMVTGNLTGSAINLGSIDNYYNSIEIVIIPSTGCTIPAISLDYILEGVTEKKDLKSSFKQDATDVSRFMLEFFMAQLRREISLVSGVFDTISVEIHFWYKQLQVVVDDWFATASSSFGSFIQDATDVSRFMFEFFMVQLRRGISLVSGVFDTVSVEIHFWYKQLEAVDWFATASSSFEAFKQDATDVSTSMLDFYVAQLRREISLVSGVFDTISVEIHFWYKQLQAVDWFATASSSFGSFKQDAMDVFRFMLEFLMAQLRRQISLVCGVFDTVSVEIHFWYYKLEAAVSDLFASTASSTCTFGSVGDMENAVKTFSGAWEEAFERLEHHATDFFAPSPPPPSTFLESMATNVFARFSDAFGQIYEKLDSHMTEFSAPPPPSPKTWQSIASGVLGRAVSFLVFLVAMMREKLRR